MVYKVLMDADKNRANGLLYIDRNTHQPKEVHGRAVILCAQALESVRILLNSANPQYPAGLANSSGVLGHYLMDHITGGGASGQLEGLPGKPSMNGPTRPDGLYKSQQRFGLYRWHITDPVRFGEDLKVTIQALGWRTSKDRRYLPLQDDIASTAFWYQTLPTAPFPQLPDADYLEVV